MIYGTNGDGNEDYICGVAMSCVAPKGFHKHPVSKVHVGVRLFAQVWFIANFCIIGCSLWLFLKDLY